MPVRTQRHLLPTIRCDRALSLILLFSISASLPGLCQNSEPKFSHISTGEGLSHLSVSRIVQDGQGYLWVGTEHGLNKYDGLTFAVYSPDPGDTNAIGGFTVTGLAVDINGRLWIGTGSGGLDRYDADTHRFVRVRPRSDPSVQDALAFVGPVYTSEDGSVWFGGYHGLWRYDPDTDQIASFTYRPGDTTSVSSNNILSLCVGADRTIWVGTDSGLNRYLPGAGRFQRYYTDSPASRTEAQQWIIAIASDQQGVTWAGSPSGLWRVDETTKTLVSEKYALDTGGNLGSAFIQALYVDGEGILWIGTRDDGLLKRDPSTGRVEQYRHDPSNKKSLDQNRVDCIYQDRSGVIWVGTYRGGLNKHDPNQDHFIHYRVNGGVYAVYEDTHGDVWVGTNGEGLLRYARSTPTVTRFIHDPHRNGSIADDFVRAIEEDHNGDIWVGTGLGVDRFSRITGTFAHYNLTRLFPGKVSDAGVKTIHRDSEGDLWVGTMAVGLARYDRKKDRFVLYSTNREDPTSVSGNSVWALQDDRDGRLWVGTFGNGLNRFDKETGRFTRIPGDTAAAIYSIYRDRAGYLWVGTFGNGLKQLGSDGRPVRQLTTRDGLPDDYVKGILSDRTGRIWLSTDKGIARLNPSTGEVRIFTESDGLLGNIFLSGSLFRNNQGLFYFGGEGGVTAFHPDSVKERSFRPAVVITGFNVLEKPFRIGHVSAGVPSVDLSHEQNFFSFEFVAFDYAAPSKNRYRYMLEGVDQEWVDAGTRRYANYTNVAPGSYTFRVRASNSDGVWSGGGASMQISIAPPFWETWWFRVSALISVAAIVVAGYNYRVNRLLEIERLRVRIASDLHDEVGSSLTRISLQSEMMREGIEGGDMNTQLTGIAQMSRDLVTTIGDIVWSIDARNDTLDNLLIKMKDFASSTLSARQIRLSFSHSGLDLKKKITVDVRENIYLIYKEVISNIARHSEATEVRVVLRNNHDKFTMVVVENGVGWDEDARPAGHGIRNMTMRAERLGGSIAFTKDDGVRTVLTLKPL
jgi:ligand-binding sensor domain-containing protein